MSEKNSNNKDLLTQFFDHSPNYKNKRNSSYLKFLKRQLQHKISNFNYNLYMTFIFKPSKLLVANLSIFLVIVFSLISFGFGLVTQAQSSPGASFLPTDTVDTTRLDDCNLDIIFPKRIDASEATIYSKQGLQDLDNRNKIDTFERNFTLAYNFNGSFTAISIDCYVSDKTSQLDFLNSINKKLNIQGKVLLKEKISSLSEAKNQYNLKIFENPAVKNINVLVGLEGDKKEPVEYLVFDIKNYKYLIRTENAVLKVEGEPIESVSVTTRSVDLNKYVPGFDLQYNEKSDFVFSRPIVYDENGNFVLQQPFNEWFDDLQIQSMATRDFQRFVIVTAVSLVFLFLAGVSLVHYMITKKFAIKIDLQSKFRILIALAGLVFMIFNSLYRNIFTYIPSLSGTSLVDFNNGNFLESILVTGYLVIALSLIYNGKRNNNINKLDLAFVVFCILYYIVLFVDATYLGYIISLFSFGALQVVLSLGWIVYGIGNAYLAINRNIVKK